MTLFLGPKNPVDVIDCTFNFLDALKTGDSVATLTDSNITPAGGSLEFDGSPSLSGNVVSFTLTGGTAGYDYYVDFTVTTTLGETLNRRARVLVADL